jgi:hypothetical protein
MRTRQLMVLALLSITLTTALTAEDTFKAAPPEQYAHQQNDKVTVGAKPFSTSEDTKRVFGKKVDLNHYGILPVLMVIRNDRSETIDLNGLEVKLVPGSGQSVIPLEPSELPALANPGKVPDLSPSRSPIPHSHKNPLESLSIVERAFTARMTPPGSEASGFFYFQATPEPGMKLLVKGIYERPSGKEIFYFEIPL